MLQAISVRRHEAEFADGPADLSEYPAISDPETRTFHLKEYEILRTEILNRLNIIYSTPVYTLIAIGAFYTFMLTSEAKGSARLPIFLIQLAWFIPVFLSFFGFLLANNAASSVEELGYYVSRLEIGLGHDSYGWEKYLHVGKRSWRKSGQIRFIAIWSFWPWFWMPVIGATLAAALIGLLSGVPAEHAGVSPR
jgi:hypothetical protein